jgi:hypothetical protein
LTGLILSGKREAVPTIVKESLEHGRPDLKKLVGYGKLPTPFEQFFWLTYFEVD